MAHLMGELHAWKRQNEVRMHELAQRTSEWTTPCITTAGARPPSTARAADADADDGRRPLRDTELSLPPRPSASAANGTAGGAHHQQHARSRASAELPPARPSSLTTPRASETAARAGVGGARESSSRAACSLREPHRAPLAEPSSSLSARRSHAARPEEGRSLRALQKELDSLKSSLSVYLGSGL
jgi:hypothetical protein